MCIANVVEVRTRASEMGNGDKSSSSRSLYRLYTKSLFESPQLSAHNV